MTPTYSYKCPGCGHKEEIDHPMAHTDKGYDCGACSEPTFRDYTANKPTINAVRGAGGSPGRYGR